MTTHDGRQLRLPIVEALELADRLDNPDCEEEATAGFVFGLAALYASDALSEAEAAQYERVLKARVKRRRKAHPVEAGRAAMNLATFYRSHGRPEQAMSHYETAARLDAGYRDRAHYWFELGGALWGVGRYLRAAEAYGRAIELGSAEPLALALQADGLLFAGHYAHALTLFERFIEASPPEDDGEYRLKRRAVAYLIERLGFSDQRRDHKRLDEILLAGDEPQTSDEWIAVSNAQLAADALWGSAWLNLGVAEREAGRLTDAMECDVLSTILIPEDYEAWGNAIFSALRCGELGVLVDLIVVGRRLGGKALIESVVQRSVPMPPAVREQFLAALDKTLGEEHRRDPARIKLRMLSETGAVEEVVIADPSA